MQSRLVLGWGSRGGGIKQLLVVPRSRSCCVFSPPRRRIEPPVHGLKRPVTRKIINEEEVEEEIQKAKQEKEEKRKEVEKTGIPARPL